MPGKEEKAEAVSPLYLDPNALDSPTEALAGAMREALQLGDRVEANAARYHDAAGEGRAPSSPDIAAGR